MLMLLFAACGLLPAASPQLFHPQHSITFSSPSKDYFGYSVFIQQGNPPKLVVGAPKGEVDQIGRVHVCPIGNQDKGNCESYTTLETDDVVEIRNRSMFGGSISGGAAPGDPIMVCAPKFTVSVTVSRSENYFTNGACYFLSELERRRRHILRNSESDFDESLRSFVVGAPGEVSFTGNVLQVSQESNQLPPQARQLSSRHSYRNLRNIFFINSSDKIYSYRGYAVGTGRFTPDGNVSFVIGSPRANDLKGEVELRLVNQRGRSRQVLQGSSFGAYFGSAVCALDVTGDGLDELLVGAPNYKSDKFDEGAVYFYRNVNGELRFVQIIQQDARQPGGRFGAAISKLPNVTEDSIDGVVISSPNEDEGLGAVYVYLYLDNSWKMHQRIQMEGQMGFGYSLSKAIDVTNDNFNDIAVGSYKTNSAVLLKSRQIFHYVFEVRVAATLYSYKENPPFDVTFCVGLRGVPSVPSRVSFVISDSRANLNQTYNTHIEDKFCQTVNIVLSTKLSSTMPLQLRISAQETQHCPSCAISSPSKKNYISHEIPFLVDCGEDQICTPNLKISGDFDVDEPFVVGSKSPIKLEVQVENSDEPAYLCKATLHMPTDVSLKSSTATSCERSAENCSLTDIIQDKTSIVFNLNVERFNDIASTMDFGLRLACVNYTTSTSFSLGLMYRSELEPKGINYKLVYKNKNVTASLEYKHGFFIRNKGPSPLRDFPVVFRLPHKILSLKDNAEIFQIFKPEFPASLMKCEENLPVYSEAVNGNVTVEETVLAAGFVSPSKQGDFKCGSPNTDLECLNVKCKISLNKLQELKVEFVVRPDIPKLLRIFENTFGLVANLEYVLDNEKHIEHSEVILQETISEKAVQWYWILLGVLLGLALLILLVYLLHKYNFFQRKTREQLAKEKTERQVQEMSLDVKDDEDEIVE